MSPNPIRHRFLLDENIDVRLGKFLTNRGYQVLFCPKGVKNGQVITLSKDHLATLITLDKDFANPDLHSPLNSPGVIVLRIHPPTLDNLESVVNKLLSSYEYNELANKMFIVSLTNVEIITS